MTRSTALPSAAARLRGLISSGAFLVAPGVYDGYSVRLAAAAGFSCAATSGAAIANAVLGIEDVGLMGLAENVAQCRAIARAVSIPVTADADNGYGNPMNVWYTTRMFEDAGVAGMNIEDQASPKRCGHMPGKTLVGTAEMVKKIEAACMARRDDDFVVIARTDALAVEGLEATLERVRAYVAAGADMIFPDAVGSEDVIARIVETAGVPVSINMGFGIRARPTTPLIAPRRLKELGVRRISLPRMLPAAAIMGMRSALAAMKESVETGEAVERPDLLVGIDDIWSLMGFPAMQALERSLLTVGALEERYGNGADA
ncbi:methylisocitrate lyase [Gluconacetobacter sacchari DSM 12717]|uniref:Isocitrate lyase/PEP mutase family protein n=2 Tax=Gluconacetobacter sacchari TaxID=92759 RepID=A0A7W4IAJ2_9PROT|nr:isocitrate lyase/PEP mutase family protein [Gluconacetobacter sacchari]MBB2159232.1 isocitrate lyase/PEP mutase family protein [Gluconacetobacter sacchari]GBQ22119.1 methylisocitrate lyase [Gluconacetobacter sacchari DSM 12717]